MSMTTEREIRQGGRRWRLRLGLLAVLATLFSTLVAVTGAGTASAAVCQNEPALGNYYQIDGKWLYIFWLDSSAETFNVADSRVVINNLDAPVSATLTSQQSQTYTISNTSGATFSGLFGFLSSSVSNTITSSRTTQIGVSTTFTVPAHGRVQGDYGLVAYNVGYHVDKFELGQGKCWFHGTTYTNTNAPTIIEGWRLF